MLLLSFTNSVVLYDPHLRSTTHICYCRHKSTNPREALRLYYLRNHFAIQFASRGPRGAIKIINAIPQSRLQWIKKLSIEFSAEPGYEPGETLWSVDQDEWLDPAGESEQR